MVAMILQAHPGKQGVGCLRRLPLVQSSRPWTTTNGCTRPTTPRMGTGARATSLPSTRASFTAQPSPRYTAHLSHVCLCTSFLLVWPTWASWLLFCLMDDISLGFTNQTEGWQESPLPPPSTPSFPPVFCFNFHRVKIRVEYLRRRLARQFLSLYSAEKRSSRSRELSKANDRKTYCWERLAWAV